MIGLDKQGSRFYSHKYRKSLWEKKNGINCLRSGSSCSAWSSSMEGVSHSPHPSLSRMPFCSNGTALVLLSIAAILAGTAFENKQRIAIISSIGLVMSLGFLYLPVPSILHGSTFHILFACAIAFGMTTAAKRAATIGAAALACIGIVFLYQPFFPSLNSTALHLLLPGVIVFSIVFSQKTLCEQISVGLNRAGFNSALPTFSDAILSNRFPIVAYRINRFYCRSTSLKNC